MKFREFLSRLKGDKRVSPASFVTCNRSVNFELESIFVAIPKNGTTSVSSQLSPAGRAMIPTYHLNICQVRDCIYPYLLIRNIGVNKQFPTTQVPSDSGLRFEAKRLFESFFKFAAVRNPWARAVSLYYRREGVMMNHKMSFREFCEGHLYASDTSRHPTLHKNQMDWLTDEEGNSLMDYVYKVEEYDQAIEEIAERTNGRIRLIPREKNVNPNSQSTRYRDLYDDYTRRLIETRFQRDIDMFQYAF